MINKPNEQVKILIVDDNPVNIDFMVELLEEYDVRTVTSGQLALESARNETPDLVLLDVTMPGLNGFETCQQLKASPKTKDIPVIFLSASKDTASIVKGFQVGGIDYITKPYNTEEVQVRIQTHLKLKFAMEKLEYINKHDELTGALKRDAFIKNSVSWLRRANKVSLPLHLFIVSVKNSKSINNTYGYQVGDSVIKAVVVVAKKIIKKDYIIARFIGGEFIILFRDVSEEESLSEMKQFQNAMGQLRFKKIPDLHVSIALAMTASTSQDRSIEDTIKRAEKRPLSS
ncbi:MAG: hypothetical protein DRG24_05490 [Epsilonproteobacteria bacterium]|nr:MAG: hypothetical protein DRG24_05490 [Campylobacterota bacterium]